MNEPLIQLAGVCKAYRFFSLTDVHLRLEAGQVMGLVGPNGAGKTTMIRLLMGMVRQDRGEVRVLGHPIPEGQALAKQDIGFASEEMRLYGQATLGWHMRLVRDMRASWDEGYAAHLLCHFNLHPDQRVRELSHGERVKAMLLLALAPRPRLLLLDEPTTGLDPVARHELLVELMDVVRDDRRAILFSSHHTQDVEQISDVITFLDRGRIVESRDKESFVDRWRRVFLDLPAGTAVPALPGAVSVTTTGRAAVVTTREYSPAVEEMCARARVTVRDVQRLTLEEIFVATVTSQREEQQR
ncbi:MAG: ABC transporter ATP-binding protein [Vicinamibacteraceae bacterium]|nr:ABC transporter ATP-binding protein [Vicinamibacteraceae bacterium]